MSHNLRNTVIAAGVAALGTLGAAGASAQEFTGGLTAYVLTPFHSEGQTTGFGMTVAPSAWIGYERADGLGFRASYFGVDAKGPTTSRYDRIVMTTVDLEVTNSFTLGTQTDATFSGGLRYAHYREEDGAGPGYLEFPAAYGLTAGLELKRGITDNLSLFGKGKGAFLFAPNMIENGNPSGAYTFSTGEIEGGLEYRRAYGAGSEFYARLGMTAQIWNGVSDNDSEDTGMAGGLLELGITF